MTQTLGNYVPAGYPNIDDPRALGKFVSSELAKVSKAVALINQQIATDESAWTSYTPVVTANSGTFTSVSAVGSYHSIGKTVHFHVEINITTNGTAASTIMASLPVPNNTKRMACAVRIGGSASSTGVGSINGAALPNAVNIVKYDGTYPGADGVLLFFAGIYEAA